LELLKPAHGDLSVPALLAGVERGDAGFRRVVADAGAAVGAAAATLCNLFNPERIVVGGDLAAAGEALIAPLRAAIERSAIQSAADDVEIVASTLGERAEVLGATALALHDAPLSAGPSP